MKALLAIAVAFSVAPEPEIFRFEGGAEICGVALKENTDSVFVDAGYTVLEVPKKHLRERTPVQAEKVAEEKARSIYFTRELSRAPIKDLVDRFGEGVVLVKTPSGLGSGFIVNDEEGYVVTNFHVIEKETKISVTIFKRTGQEMKNLVKQEVRIVALSADFDLALLQIEKFEKGELRKVYLGSYDTVSRGDQVFAVGNPLGLTRTVTEGIVSNRSREMDGRLFIQTTAAINPGNSGGPLFNDRGEVIGVNTLKVMRAGVEGLSFAIPAHYVADFLTNREAFAYDKENANSGIRFLEPPRKGK